MKEDESIDTFLISNEKKIVQLNSNYLIDKGRIFGSGGFGQVVRAIDLHHPQANLVVKVMESNDFQQIEKEINCLKLFTDLANKGSPYFSTYYDNCSTPDKFYLILPEIDGTSLFEYMRGRNEGLSQTEAFMIGYQLAKGIKLMAENGIIHRDIKPGNIMIKNNYSIKILDPGLCILLTEEQKKQQQLAIKNNWNTKRQLTIPCDWCGTRLYMAPEIFCHYFVIDGRTDIYSFGLVLANMLLSANDSNNFLQQALHQTNTYTQMIDLEKAPPINFFLHNTYSLDSFWTKLISDCVQTNYLHRINPETAFEQFQLKFQESYSAYTMNQKKILPPGNLHNYIACKYLQLVEQIERLNYTYKEEQNKFKINLPNANIDTNFLFDIYQLKWPEDITKEQLVASLNLRITIYWKSLSFGLKFQEYFEKISVEQYIKQQGHEIDFLTLRLQILQYYELRTMNLIEVVADQTKQLNGKTKQIRIQQKACKELKKFCTLLCCAQHKQIIQNKRRFEAKFKQPAPLIQRNSQSYEQMTIEIIKQIENKISIILPIFNNYILNDLQIQKYSQYLIEFDKMLKNKEGSNYYYEPMNSFQNIIHEIEINKKEEQQLPQEYNEIQKKKIKYN